MRTRPVTLALVTAAALSGCATTPRVQGVEPAGPPPMRVWIGFPIGSSRVHPIFVNRDAHVAMFEIIPGRGVTMVHPRSSADVFASDAHYANLTLQPGRMFYYSDPFGHASVQPRYYYVVASAAPLNLSKLLSSLGQTRRVLGRMYASYRPYEVIDRLTELLVPMQADEDWATDLFVDWPMPAMPRYVAYRLIRCANGRVIQVARDYPYHGCPGDAKPAVVATAGNPPSGAAKPPSKELPFDAVPRPPKGDGRRSVELSAPDVGNSRRAEAGARRPRTGSGARPPSAGGVRYSGDNRTSDRTADRTSAAPASRPEPSAGNSGRSQTVERSEPRAQPAPEPGESGKERKPN